MQCRLELIYIFQWTVYLNQLSRGSDEDNDKTRQDKTQLCELINWIQKGILNLCLDYSNYTKKEAGGQIQSCETFFYPATTIQVTTG